MKPKDRMLAALHFRQPDDMVPAWEVEFQIYEELLGRSPVVGYEYARLSPREKECATYANAELMIEAVEATEQCALFCWPGYWEVGPGEPVLLWLPDEEARLALTRALKELGGDRYLILGHGGTVPGVPSGEHMLEYCYHSTTTSMRFGNGRPRACGSRSNGGNGSSTPAPTAWLCVLTWPSTTVPSCHRT